MTKLGSVVEDKFGKWYACETNQVAGKHCDNYIQLPPNFSWGYCAKCWHNKYYKEGGVCSSCGLMGRGCNIVAQRERACGLESEYLSHPMPTKEIYRNRAINNFPLTPTTDKQPFTSMLNNYFSAVGKLCTLVGGLNLQDFPVKEQRAVAEALREVRRVRKELK